MKIDNPCSQVPETSRDFPSFIFKGDWPSVLSTLCTVYTFINFIYFSHRLQNVPHKKPGFLFLVSRGYTWDMLLALATQHFLLMLQGLWNQNVARAARSRFCNKTVGTMLLNIHRPELSATCCRYWDTWLQVQQLQLTSVAEKPWGCRVPSARRKLQVYSIYFLTWTQSGNSIITTTCSFEINF